MLKNVIGYGLAAYCLALLGIGLWLSHYPWPMPDVHEPAEEEVVVDIPPPDFKAIRDTSARKAAFFAYLTPLVERENQRILALREQLAKLSKRAKSGELRGRDRRQLAE